MGITQDFKKRGMGYALALSLVLHIVATLALIIAGSFEIGGDKIPGFIIQDVALAPSISAPAKPMEAPPSEPSSAVSSPPSAEQEPANPPQEPAPESSQESADGSGESSRLMSTPLGLGMTHGYFSGLADGRTLRDDIRGYYFEMVEKINLEWWNQAVLLKEPIRQDGIFEVLLQRDGTVVSIRVMQGTGLVEADRLLVDIIRKASPLPPLPSSYDLGLFRAPLRIKAPSFLFRLGK